MRRALMWLNIYIVNKTRKRLIFNYWTKVGFFRLQWHLSTLHTMPGNDASLYQSFFSYILGGFSRRVDRVAYILTYVRYQSLLISVSEGVGLYNCNLSRDHLSFFWLYGILSYAGALEISTFYTSFNQLQNSKPVENSTVYFGTCQFLFSRALPLFDISVYLQFCKIHIF